MVTYLSHQSRRALPRDWVASKVAVHEDCDLVNMFLSSISQRCFGLSHQIPRCTFQRDKSRIHEAHSFSGPNVLLFQQDPIYLGPSMNVSCMQICIVLLHLSSESDLRLPSNTSLSCSFSRGVLTCFSVRIASWFTDDEWCMSQARFNVQVLSSLINSNSKHTVQQQKAFHVFRILCVWI